MNEERAKKKEEKKEAKLSETLSKEIEKLKEENIKLSNDVNQWKNSYYKCYADTENLRKSIEKDHREAMKYRAEGFVYNLLTVLDGFHFALSSEVKSEELKNYLVGFQYIYNNLTKVLEDEGVKEISPKVGDQFDERNMEAIESIYQEGEPNKIIKVSQKGYMLKDHLVRPAMVVVSTNKKAEEENKKEDPNIKKEDNENKETPKENEDNQNKNNQA